MTIAGFLTLSELAGKAGIAQATLRQRIARGTLKASKVGPIWIVSNREANKLVARRAAVAKARADRTAVQA